MRTDVTIRPERPEEFDAIDDLVRRSFGEGTPYSDGSTEVQLIHEIREGGYHLPALSFIADLDGEIVGHVMFSRLPISPTFERGNLPPVDAETPLAMMSPVAVHADRLGQGIGTAMLTQAIERVKRDGRFRGVLVEGNPAYYRRFGFITSGQFAVQPGETCVYPQTHPECLMLQETSPGSLSDISGFVNYDMYPAIVDHTME